MKVLLLVTGLLASSALVQGGVPRSQDPDKVEVPEVSDEAPPEERFDPSKVTFHYYSREHLTAPVQLYIGFMNGIVMDFSKPVKVIVHGWTENGRADWIIDFKNKYLDNNDYHVISVDWEEPGGGPYDNAKQRTKPTGEVIGQFLEYLMTEGGDLGKMHCVGFSLGAHACGFAGKYQTERNRTLGRITGLDPALPLFDYENPGGRLDDSDASFVDVVHTCGGWLAYWHRLGHADFYPNDGTSVQPGCGLDVTGACSHGRSHELFAESITETTFVSKICESFPMYQTGACDQNEAAPLGELCPTSARGSYFLATRGRSPFALG